MQKKKIAIIIFISVCIVLILPFALELLVYRNNIYSVLSNGEWSGFLGSYIGGVLGGVGTLLAVYITTKETRKIQQDNSLQIEDEKKRNEKKERKQFADEIAKDISIYITYISNYFYGCRLLGKLDSENRNLKNALFQTEQKISKHKSDLDNLNILLDTQKCTVAHNELNKLKHKKAEIRHQLKCKSKEIERNRTDRLTANEHYFLLKIKLQNIESGSNILKQLKYIHDNSSNVDGTDLNFINIETDKLLHMTVQFVDRYVNQKLD